MLTFHSCLVTIAAAAAARRRKLASAAALEQSGPTVKQVAGETGVEALVPAVLQYVVPDFGVFDHFFYF